MSAAPQYTAAAREEGLLAPYAFFSRDTRGRRWPEDEHSYRGPFQRDRDRVLHCSAFRRLAGKMQVFTGEMGDYHRTRLTHTLEVTSIARTVGRALRLNEDLIEVLAYLHDLGHPPFGHAGEDALDECLQDEGGFSHNRFALTLVEELAGRYPSFPGLNLSYEVLEGQSSRLKSHAAASPLPPLWETQVVDAADSITYDAHDADDALKLGLVTTDELREIPLVRELAESLEDRFGPLEGKRLRKALVHALIDRQVTSVLEAAERYLATRAPASAEEARQTEFRFEVDGGLARRKRELEAFLYERVYRHPQVLRVRREAQGRLQAMFEGYVRYPERLPVKFRERAGQVGIRRAAGDYLAGMTDRYCDEQYRRQFENVGHSLRE
jgi:dGTPase